MKIYGFTAALLMVCRCIIAQTTLDWAPVGAKWYYEEIYWGSSKISYVMIESIKDTIVNNHLCRKMVLSKPAGLVAPFNTDTIYYTYKENDTIFLYNTIDNKFRPIFANNLQIGDTLKLSWNIQNFGNCNYSYLIDTIYYVNINGLNIKKIRLDYSLEFLENIGGIGYNILTPLIEKYECTQIIVDGTYYKFRCYYHPVYGLFKLSSEACDYVYTGIEEYSILDELVYSRDKTLYLKGICPLPVQIKINSIDGKLMKQIYKEDLMPILLNDLNDGIYLCDIIMKDKVYKKKLILN